MVVRTTVQRWALAARKAPAAGMVGDGGDSSAAQRQTNVAKLPANATRLQVHRARERDKRKRKETTLNARAGKAVPARGGGGAGGGGAKRVNIGSDDGGDGRNAYTVGALLAAATASSASRRGNAKGSRKRRTRTQAARRGAPLLGRTETTANLSDRQREHVIASEVAHIREVQAHPAFQADPLGSLQQHLAATARMLVPPNPECARAPRDGARQGRRA